MKLTKLDCGLHFGKGGRCAKCSSGITHRTIAGARNQALVAALEPVDDSIQERAIQAAHRNFRPL
jgi:hypothetical protein